MLTFTRAATHDLAEKMGNANVDVAQPTTIHSFALSLLLRNPEAANLPTPLRIPDSWETGELIRSDLARRLRQRGFQKVTVYTIKKLERELAAQWQSLDPSSQLLAELDPNVRNAYVGLWAAHRRTYGYTLLAELPFRAANAMEDFDAEIGALDFLVVDEYQDLNQVDIRLIRLISARGARVLAIGDDDQSIYRFRMAAPAGIRRFREEFGVCQDQDYQLTVSQRCGENIINAATMLIETAPDRPRKPPLTFKEGADPGVFFYLRFDNDRQEIDGVADLIHARYRAGVPLGEIAVLVRSKVNIWAGQLVPALEDRGIHAVNTDWVDACLGERGLRASLATLRLAVNREDSLAWWTALNLQNGVTREFCDYIHDTAVDSNRTFGQTLLALYPDFPRAPTAKSATAAARLVSSVLGEIEELGVEAAQLGDSGWGGWIVDVLGPSCLTQKAVRMFQEVGSAFPAERGLGYFLAQVEPIAKDLATQSDGVRIMTMTASKGLTLNTCVVMGVERNLVPHPRGDLNEERRLLYVAMTRATDLCVLTFAHRRRGQIARHGAASVNRPRRRSPLLENLPIGEFRNGRQVVNQLMAEVRETAAS
jgi:DNA helicase-2/ATP-dependent DNA helicase PcrA